MRLDATQFLRTEISACDFSVAGEDGIFAECAFEATRVSGKLVHWRFVDCDYRGLDLSKAHLAACAAIEPRKTGVQWPSRPDNFVVAPGAFVTAKTLLAETLSAESFATFSSAADWLAGYSDRLCIDLSTLDEAEEEFVALPKGDRELIMETLFEVRDQG